MRHDLFPPEWIRALETLQDSAPVLPYDAVRGAVEQGLGKPIQDLFATFSPEPMATASIAQVHRARTLGGEEVVVKARRPGIERQMRGDLDLLYLLSRGIESTIDEAAIFGVSDIVVEFERGVLQELNFNTELGNLTLARELLDPERPVRVPKPFPELSCKTVLTMEFFAGRPVRDLEPGSPLAKHAVEEVVHAAFKQVFFDGFFHGDPHAGNILINDNGEMCMIDLGLMGRLSPDQRDDLVTVSLAIAANDSSTIARLLLRMGTPTERVSLEELKKEISRLRGQFLTVKDVTEVEAGEFVQSFAGAARRFRIKLATEYTILAKAAAAIEGLIRRLHPKVDILGISQGYTRKIIAERYSPGRVVQEALGGASGILSLLRHLPMQAEQVLYDLETGNTQVRALTPELDDIPAKLHQVGGRIALTGFAVAMSLCAALVLPASSSDTFRVWLCVALALMAAGAWTTLSWWHFLGRGKRIALAPLIKLIRR